MMLLWSELVYAVDAPLLSYGRQATASGNAPAPCTVQALIAGPDGYVWACHKHGLLERYTASGCLQWFKVERPDTQGCVANTNRAQLRFFDRMCMCATALIVSQSCSHLSHQGR
jgi:ligand-binding sensor domain-containing protein